MYTDATSRTVHAQLAMGLGQVALVQECWPGVNEHHGSQSVHHLQLSLLPFADHGRGCFPEAWGRNRFEPIGALFLFPADQVVHVRNTCQEQKSIVYTVDSQSLERWFEPSSRWTSSHLERSLAITDPEIRRLMTRIGHELRNPGFASAALIELMAAEVLIALSRQLRRVDVASIGGGLAPWRLRLIDEFLEAHAGTASLADLAQHCRLSVRQLSRAFRLSRGCSIGSYIAQTRMEEARRRLASGVAVKVVARQLGFASTSNFSAAFRRATGETPGHSALRMPD